MRQILNRQLLFFLASFILSLSPFLLFPQHRYVYYLSFAAIWFSASLAVILSEGWRRQRQTRILTIVTIFLLGFVSCQTVNLYQTTYWAAKRAAAAKFIVSDILKAYPSIPTGAVFYIKNDPSYPFISSEWGGSSKQAFYILSGADALKLLYHDLSIKVYFEDVVKPLNQLDPSIKIYTAKFPY